MKDNFVIFNSLFQYNRFKPRECRLCNVQRENTLGGNVMKRKDCIAMLLAGGEGKRLAPLTSKLAKPAVPLADIIV